MHGGDGQGGELRMKHPAAVAKYAHLSSQKGLSRGGAHAYDDLRADDAEFRFEPGAAGVLLGSQLRQSAASRLTRSMSSIGAPCSQAFSASALPLYSMTEGVITSMLMISTKGPA